MNIKRIIQGNPCEFTLTEAEMQAAYAEKLHERDLAVVRDRLSPDEGEPYTINILSALALENADIIEFMADQVRQQIEDNGIHFDESIDHILETIIADISEHIQIDCPECGTNLQEDGFSMEDGFAVDDDFDLATNEIGLRFIVCGCGYQFDEKVILAKIRDIIRR